MWRMSAIQPPLVNRYLGERPCRRGPVNTVYGEAGVRLEVLHGGQGLLAGAAASADSPHADDTAVAQVVLHRGDLLAHGTELEGRVARGDYRGLRLGLRLDDDYGAGPGRERGGRLRPYDAVYGDLLERLEHPYGVVRLAAEIAVYDERAEADELRPAVQ